MHLTDSHSPLGSLALFNTRVPCFPVLDYVILCQPWLISLFLLKMQPILNFIYSLQPVCQQFDMNLVIFSFCFAALPESSRIRQTAKKSGYWAKPGEFMLKWVLQNISMCPPIISSNVPLHALATEEVPVRKQRKLGSRCLLYIKTNLSIAPNSPIT